jgi:hypothetical protein
MKKIYRKLIPLCLGGVVLFSCHKDDEVKKSDPLTQIPSTFSELTVEQNKTQLEDNGIEVVNGLTELKNSLSVKSSISFSSFLNQASPDNSGMRKTRGLQIVNLLSMFGKGQISSKQLLTNLRTSEDTSSVSVQEIFSENVGVYTWDGSNKDWAYSKTGSAIVFKFPSTEAGTSNNAVFTIHDYKGVNTPSGFIEDYQGDLPTQLMAELVVDGTKVLEYSYAASYNSNGEPTSFETNLVLNAFKFHVKLSNDTKVAKSEYSLSKSDKILIGYGSEVKGNFASSNVLASESPSSVIESAAAYFQFMNIRFAGNANVTAIDNTMSSNLTVNQKVEALNKNYKLVVYYIDSEKKIADTEFYTTKHTYTTWKYNSTTQEYEEVEVTEDEADIRLAFADGSKSDLETYTNTGFKDLEDSFVDFANAIEADVQ